MCTAGRPAWQVEQDRAAFDGLDEVARGLGYAMLVKTNADEFDRVWRHIGLAAEASELFDCYEALDYVCVTRGGDGAELHTRGGASDRITSERVEPVDTVGTGDAFVASIAPVSGESPRRALLRADELARLVLAYAAGFRRNGRAGTLQLVTPCGLAPD